MSKKLSCGCQFRWRGQVWNAQGVPRKKVKASSADLREGKTTLEECEVVIEGKKSELASIFEKLRPTLRMWTTVGS